MRTPRLVIVVALLALTACGPAIPLNTGLKEASSDILFGHPPASPPPPPLPQVRILPAPLELPPPIPGAPPATFAAVPAAPVTSCPDASPSAVPAVEAPASASVPPAAATYDFRYRGSLTLSPGQVGQQVTNVPASGTRQVIPTSQPSAIDGSYTYSVVETFNGQQLKTDFAVYPAGHTLSGAQALVPSRTPDAGIYFTGYTLSKAGSTDPPTQFTPEPPIQVDVFDDSPGQTWQGGAGTDPVDEQTLTVDGNANANGTTSSVVTGRVRVNACGELIQAWEVQLAGTFSDARGAPRNPAETYTLALDFATQYGGISVQDHLHLQDHDPQTGQARTYDLTATIDQTPKTQ
jgi:hypothetical protein